MVEARIDEQGAAKGGHRRRNESSAKTHPQHMQPGKGQKQALRGWSSALLGPRTPRAAPPSAEPTGPRVVLLHVPELYGVRPPCPSPLGTCDSDNALLPP